MSRPGSSTLTLGTLNLAEATPWRMSDTFWSTIMSSWAICTNGIADPTNSKFLMAHHNEGADKKKKKSEVFSDSHNTDLLGPTTMQNALSTTYFAAITLTCLTLVTIDNKGKAPDLTGPGSPSALILRLNMLDETRRVGYNLLCEHQTCVSLNPGLRPPPCSRQRRWRLE